MEFENDLNEAYGFDEVNEASDVEIEAFDVEIEASGEVIEASDEVIEASDVVTGTSDVVTEAFDVVTEAFDVVTVAYDVMIVISDEVKEAFEVFFYFVWTETFVVVIIASFDEILEFVVELNLEPSVAFAGVADLALNAFVVKMAFVDLMPDDVTFDSDTSMIHDYVVLIDDLEPAFDVKVEEISLAVVMWIGGITAENVWVVVEPTDGIVVVTDAVIGMTDE